MKLLGYLWALPVTLVGLLLALVTLSTPFVVLEGAVLFLAGPGLRWFFRATNVAAFTWGGAIFFAKDPVHAGGVDLFLIRHEVEHWRQAMVWGPLFPFAYGVASLVALVRGRRAYFDNWFEVAARAKENP